MRDIHKNNCVSYMCVLFNALQELYGEILIQLYIYSNTVCLIWLNKIVSRSVTYQAPCWKFVYSIDIYIYLYTPNIYILADEYAVIWIPNYCTALLPLQISPNHPPLPTLSSMSLRNFATDTTNSLTFPINIKITYIRISSILVRINDW